MTPDAFKAALSCWCSGVTVVTTRDTDGLVYGLTVSSFTSVSLEPPLVSVCIDNRNRLPSIVERSKAFAISILGIEQEAISNHFASRGRAPAAQFEFASSDTVSGQPVLDGSLAWLSCEVHDAVVAGDHTVLIGRVVQTHADGDVPPLLYYKRAYRTVTG